MNGVCSGLGIMNFPDGSKYDERMCSRVYFSSHFPTGTKENLCKDGSMEMEFSSVLMA